MKNYLSQMLYALTSPYSRKDYDNQKQGLGVETNIGKLFSILAYGLDLVDEQAELILKWDDIDNAEGAVLDRHGANWGVKRVTSNDAIYRIAIKVKILSQLSGGDIDTVIRAAGSLLDVNLSEILLEEVYPAKIALYVDWELLSEERKDLIESIAYAVKRIMATGVGLRLYCRTYRTYRLDVPLSRLAITSAYLNAIPVSQPRSSTQDYRVNRGASVYKYQQPAQPDAVKTSSDRQSRVGGAMCHTHLKAKRIS